MKLANYPCYERLLWLYYKQIMNTDRVTLKIPRPLYEKLKVVIQGSSYRSVNEFVVYVLRDLMAEQSQPSTTNLKELTEREIAIIRDRLRRLGYL